MTPFLFCFVLESIARIILRLKHILELEDMMRHVLKVIPGFKPLEASNIKAKDTPTRSIASSSFTSGIAIQSSHGKGKGSTRGMHNDTSSLSKPLMITSNEAVAYESLAPYLRELEVTTPKSTWGPKTLM